MNTENLRSPNAAGAGFIGLLLVLALLGSVALTFPLRKGLRLNRQIEAARERIETLESLHPLYLELHAFAPDAHWQDLPKPAKQPLTQAEVENIPTVFTRLSRECQMEVISVRPRVNSSQEGACQLQVDLRVAGPYAGIRDFLLAIVGLPSLDQVNTLEIKQTDLHKTLNFSFTLALQ